CGELRREPFGFLEFACGELRREPFGFLEFACGELRREPFGFPGTRVTRNRDVGALYGVQRKTDVSRKWGTER
ncbi:MAG: hypothetical protein OEY41_09550, partial [Acidimicrobiia bacterium]|nr:hypothetical protein [Acidimicrobiia bacterium]